MNDVFYIIKPAVGTKETGMAYPAVESFDDYDFNAPNSVHKLRAKEFPDSSPDLRFRLAKGAKLCDLMGQATINAPGLLISEKLKTILENAEIVPHKFYQATIKDKEIIHQYYWVHFVWDDGGNVVDFHKSDFFARKFSKNLGKVVVENEEDILVQRSKFDISTLIDFNVLSLRKFDKDLFFFNYFTEIYVTEKFKDFLESYNLTGIEFERTNKLHLQA